LEKDRQPRWQARGGASLATPLSKRYSTVTDFARLRGWSTSVPMKTAV